MRTYLISALLLGASLLPGSGFAQTIPEPPAEIGVREYLPAPSQGIALYEHRSDVRPARQWPGGRKLYVQTAPDTMWFRVLIAGNSYFVRQREMPVPGWHVVK